MIILKKTLKSVVHTENKKGSLRKDKDKNARNHGLPRRGRSYSKMMSIDQNRVAPRRPNTYIDHHTKMPPPSMKKRFATGDTV